MAKPTPRHGKRLVGLPSIPNLISRVTLGCTCSLHTPLLKAPPLWGCCSLSQSHRIRCSSSIHPQFSMSFRVFFKSCSPRHLLLGSCCSPGAQLLLVRFLCCSTNPCCWSDLHFKGFPGNESAPLGPIAAPAKSSNVLFQCSELLQQGLEQDFQGNLNN